MVLSEPVMIFNPTGPIAIGEIDVDDSSAEATYHIKFSLARSSKSYASMANMSISFKTSTNSDEPNDEHWLCLSTATEETSVGDSSSSECAAPSVVCSAGTQSSTRIEYQVKVPADAATSGTVRFKFLHRYQYTG